MFQKNINNRHTSACYTTESVSLPFDLMTKESHPQESHDWYTAHFSRKKQTQKLAEAALVMKKPHRLLTLRKDSVKTTTE